MENGNATRIIGSPEECCAKCAVKARVGANIRRLREEMNIPEEEMSGVLDITPGLLALVERGRRGLSPLKLLRCAQKLGVSVDMLNI